VPLASSAPLRGALLAVATALAVTALAHPVDAAGTGGIEVTPDPPVVDGEQATAFHVEVPDRGEQSVPFTVRNVEDEVRSARLYTAGVAQDQQGTLSLGDPGSSPFVSLRPEEITLAPGEVQQRTFTLQGGDLHEDEDLAAVVVEVRSGSVVQRASTLVYLDSGRQLPLPLLLVVLAVVLVATAGATVATLARRPAAAA
jgi:hypothetical protein